MNDFYMFVGQILCGLGGGLLCLCVVGILLWFTCELWIWVSDRFRDICKAESLIFEYRKNRHEFMVWKHTKDFDFCSHGERKDGEG